MLEGLASAVVETATGGRLANAFTGVHDAGKFFAGVVVCCSNDAKMQLLDGPECLLKQHRAVRKVGRVSNGLNVGPYRDPLCGRRD
jgi:nicotinamide-nucleotide amidase